MSEKIDIDQLDDLELYDLYTQSDEGKAREKLAWALIDLSHDPDIQKSSVCIDFLRLMRAFDPSDPSLETIQDVMDNMIASFKRLRAVKNANWRHQKPREAKSFVIKEWIKYRCEYDNNKSAFARDYVRRVLNEFEVSVTEKQLREVWLKDTPSASKPDGILADG